MVNILFHSVENIIAVKKETLSALHRLGIKSVRDLLFYRPGSYKIKNILPDLSKLKDGEVIQTEVIIEDVLMPASRRQPVKIMVKNETGSILLVFFNKIPPFIFSRLRIGTRHIISGKVQYFDYCYQIAHPEFILQKDLESGIEPVYQLTYGMVNKQLYSYIIQGLRAAEKTLNLYENLPADNPHRGFEQFSRDLIRNLKMLHLFEVRAEEGQVEEIFEKARKNLARMELLANQISLALIRNQKKEKTGSCFKINKEEQQRVLERLGFTLTSAQEEVIGEIEQDQRAAIQMMRLLQGDVGAGKTLVALLTMLSAVGSGRQAALMVPTDLLANQHYQFFAKSLEESGIEIALLTGKTSAKERSVISEELQSGNILILIGTHALFQDRVSFKDLGYIVIDEQHRFGVEQRLSLINKSSHPDVLVMTATPIPRSLTLTMFGDMSVSKLTSKPKGRLPVITTSNNIKKVEEIAQGIKKMIEAGEKVYWVCPLVEKGEKDEEQEGSEMDVHSRFAVLDHLYPGRVGIAHGKMNSDARDLAMQRFKSGEISILVATTVIEVGIDVPEATLIVIENAEKFGLAQLHQLRGRVGRGEKQSYCLLLYNPKRLSREGKARLEVMRASNDGFYIAEQDLVLRGSGEILGTKQSGEPEFFFASLATDLNILTEANREAASIQKPSSLFELQIKVFAKKEAGVVDSG